MNQGLLQYWNENNPVIYHHIGTIIMPIRKFPSWIEMKEQDCFERDKTPTAYYADKIKRHFLVKKFRGNFDLF